MTTTIDELQAAPIGTLVQQFGETIYVRADRSEQPWLAVDENNVEPDAQFWETPGGIVETAERGGVTLVYPANHVVAEPEPKADSIDVLTPTYGPIVWQSASQWPGQAVQVRRTGTTHRAFVDGVQCDHRHRALDAAITCGNRIVTRRAQR